MAASFVNCSKYVPEQIKKALDELFAAVPLPDIAGKTVLLKPNMLGAYPPEMHITTNPNFVQAIAEICKEKGAKAIWIGDSHNGLFPSKNVWNKTGIRAVCKKVGATPKPFEEDVLVRDGIFLAKALFEADVIINLPKFKTHGLTMLTCAVKNLYGCVPGMRKAAYHREHMQRERFDEFLVQISQLVKPSFTIVDAIVAMEGGGPSAGKLRSLKLIFGGNDLFHVDELACRLVGIEPGDLGTLKIAKDKKLWKPSITNVASVASDFVLPPTYSRKMGDWWLSNLVIRIIWNRARVKLKINKRVCVRCMHCLEICPVDAISKDHDGFPKIEKKICGECFCCHESCERGAIVLKPTLGVRFARWIGERRGRKGQN